MIALSRIVLNRAARYLIAMVLLAAAISKVLSFAPFVQSVSRLAAQPQEGAEAIAMVTIAVEFGAALLLFSGRWWKAGAAIAGILFTVFAVVLSSAVVRGVDIPCRCFGVMGPKLSLRDQAVVDLFLALVGFFLTRPEKTPGDQHPHGRFLVGAGVLTAIAVLWGASLIVWPSPVASTDKITSAGSSLLASLVHSGVIPTGRTTVVTLADFDNFGCQLCLDDFLAMCDSLNAFANSREISVLMIARRDTSRSEQTQSRLLAGWATANRFVFPVVLDRDSLFERVGLEKNSVFLFDRNGMLITVGTFPLGWERRKELLASVKP